MEFAISKILEIIFVFYTQQYCFITLKKIITIPRKILKGFPIIK